MNNLKNTQGGFLKLIISIAIVIFLLAYFNVSVLEVVTWIKNFINSVF